MGKIVLEQGKLKCHKAFNSYQDSAIFFFLISAPQIVTRIWLISRVLKKLVLTILPVLLSHLQRNRFWGLLSLPVLLMFFAWRLDEQTCLILMYPTLYKFFLYDFEKFLTMRLWPNIYHRTSFSPYPWVQANNTW